MSRLHSSRSPISLVTVVLTLLASLLLALAAGCGGGGGSKEEVGRAQITVNWPTRSRLIPVAADSIKVDFLRGTEVVASQILARPTSGNQTTATFDNLKVGTLTLSAVAYPNSNGTGVAQAKGATPVTISNGQTSNVTLVMASTIDHVEISPNGNVSVPVGQTKTFTVTAKDSTGNVVLTLPDTIQWSSSNSALALMDASGVATGVAPTGITPGPITVTVKETESNKSASASLAVTSSTVVSVSPTTKTLSVGDPQTFTASVTGAPDTSVTWSIQEGATGGTITSGGVYTAPTLPGAYHVVATSNYDNSKKATATITAQAGDANVIIK